MMTKPMETLELRNLMIQFSMKHNISLHVVPQGARSNPSKHQIGGITA